MAVDGYLNFDTSIDTKGFNKGTKSISSSLGGLKSALGKVAVAVSAAFSVKAIVDFSKQAKAAWDTQVLAEQKLETVMKQRMNATDKSIQSIKDFASAQQEIGIVGDEVQLAGAQQVATFLNESDSIKTLLPAMNNLIAQQKGFNATSEDAVNIGNLMGKVMQGQTSALTRVGITFSDAEEQVLKYGTESEKAAMLSKVITNNVGEMNSALAKTDAGRQVQLSNTFGDIKEQFGAAVTQIKVIFLPALQLVANALARVAEFARALSQSLAEIFGVENNTANNSGALASDISNISDNAEQAASSYDDMAQAAESTQEANENSLASFDKINKLNDTDSSSSSSGGSSSSSAISGSSTRTISVTAEVETSETEKELKNFFKWVKQSFSELFKPLQKSWNKNGKSVIKSMKTAFTEVNELFAEFGSSFAEIWTNGTGERISNDLLEIWRNINNTVGNVAHQMKTAWTDDNLGTDVIQHIADIWVTILDHVNSISSKIADWVEDVDFEPLLSSFDSLTESLKPFTDHVGSGLEWFFDEVLLPMASWTIEDAIPAFLDLLSDAIDGLSSIWDTASPVIKDKLWDGFLKPIAEWTAEKSVDAVEALGDGFEKIADSIDEKDVEVLIDLAGAIASVYLAIKGKKLIDDFSTAVSGLGSTITKAFSSSGSGWNASLTTAASEGGATFATKFMAAVGAAFVGWSIGSAIRDAIGQENLDEFFFPIFDAAVYAWNSVVEFFTKTIPTYFTETLPNEIKGYIFYPLRDSAVQAWEDITSTFADIGTWFGERWSDIQTSFADVQAWFSETFSGAWSNITDAFSDTKNWFSERWNDITGVFSDVKDWFSEKFSDAWGSIKKPFSEVGEFFDGIWDDMTGGLKGAINKIIDGLNWMIGGLNKISFDIPDWLGGGTFGINIPEIPHLAKGAVIPPNSEFLAVLGDQKRGTNIEAPLDTIKQAVAEVLAAKGGGMSGPLTIPIYLNTRRGLRLLSTEIIDDINDIISSTGNVPIDL